MRPAKRNGLKHKHNRPKISLWGSGPRTAQNSLFCFKRNKIENGAIGHNTIRKGEESCLKRDGTFERNAKCISFWETRKIREKNPKKSAYSVAYSTATRHLSQTNVSMQYTSPPYFCKNDYTVGEKRVQIPDEKIRASLYAPMQITPPEEISITWKHNRQGPLSLC